MDETPAHPVAPAFKLAVFGIFLAGATLAGYFILKPDPPTGLNTFSIEQADREEVLAAYGQGKIAGRVTDTTGEALIGVNILIEGTQQGAVTDTGGNYMILNVRPGTYTLVFSYIGFQTQRLTDQVPSGETPPPSDETTPPSDETTTPSDEATRRQALDEKDAALAERPDTNEAPEIISLTARTREEAEDAHTVMQAAKDKVPSDRRQTPVYQEALSLENQGTQSFGANLYVRAFARFGEAEAKYEEAAVAQISEAVSPELQAAVNSFAQTLKTSIEQEDSNGMRAMFYRSRDWGAFFEKAEAVAVAVSPGSVQFSGNSATVPVQVALTYRDEQNQTQQETLSHLWTLQNMGGDWMLTRVRPAQ